MSDWPIEQIPDADSLYMRAHRSLFRDGEWLPGVFKDHQGGMSVDWSRYSSPEQTRLRGRRPEENAVLQMEAGPVRQLPSLQVSHSPELANRSHTDVIGEKTPEVRLKLLRITQVILPLRTS